MKIRMVEFGDTEALSQFYLTNEDFFRPWEPLRGDGYHSLENWNKRLYSWVSEQESRRAAYFLMIEETNGDIVGICSLTNMIFGPFMACHMGFGVSQKYEGKGKMIMLCQHAIEYGFCELGLNRIMANYMPANCRSATLLGRLGFVIEGSAKRYLKINGRWEDHILTSIINPVAGCSEDA